MKANDRIGPKLRSDRPISTPIVNPSCNKDCGQKRPLHFAIKSRLCKIWLEHLCSHLKSIKTEIGISNLAVCVSI